MDVPTIALTVFVVAGFTAILSFVSYSKKQSSWKGVVVGKRHEEATTDEESSSPEKFKVIVKTDSGKMITVDVFQKEYDAFSIGDRAEKKKGDYFPTKIVS